MSTLKANRIENLTTTDGGIDINNSGKVGIGTASPSATLHAKSGTTDVVADFESTDANAWIQIRDNSTTDTAVMVGAVGDDMRLRAGSNERMRIDSSGNVGVGTSSPAHIVHIADASAPELIVEDTTNNVKALLGADNSVGRVGTDSNHGFTISTNDSERIRVDTSGRLLVGTSSTIQSDAGNKLQIAADGAAGIVLGRNDQSISSGNTMGSIGWWGNDTGSYQECAQIRCDADGDHANNDKPSRLVFSTCADNAGSVTERARISSDGYFKASNDGSYSSTVSYHEFRQSNNEQMLLTRASHTSFTENMLILRARRFQTSAYGFLRCQSNDGSDQEIVLRGDGNGFADGSWVGGGADYAEYFEWSDGNTESEDRRGISVVLDGNKIREAVAGEEPIGVISGNPSVVGDTAWNHWNGKYVRDDYGTYIQEDYEVEDEDGNTVVQQRRKLNPDYDPDTEYVTRENRPEWDTVGLMGKLRIRKGQVTGTRWIKMRDVSDTVEEWLVR